MPWTITPIVSTIRWGKDHHKYGDPYDGVATVTRSGDMAYVSATCGTELKLSEMRQVFKLCKENGIKTVIWEHHGVVTKLKVSI